MIEDSLTAAPHRRALVSFHAVDSFGRRVAPRGAGGRRDVGVLGSADVQVARSTGVFRFSREVVCGLGTSAVHRCRWGQVGAASSALGEPAGWRASVFVVSPNTCAFSVASKTLGAVVWFEAL